jgi:hypothetical protein
MHQRLLPTPNHPLTNDPKLPRRIQNVYPRRLTLGSGALARVTNAFAIHQIASRPRHRASVACN